jgi:hypothetical protein
MKRFCVLLIPAAFLLSGCVSYPVRSNGYLSPDAADSRLGNAQSFYVLEEENPANPLFSTEIRDKINVLLKERGIRVDSRVNADFFLTYSYSINPGIISGVRPEIHPPDTGTVNTFTESGKTRTSYITFPGYTAYVPYRYTVHTAELKLQALDARAMRNDGTKKSVWIGENTVTSPNSDLREMINYLLVAAFGHFGENTRKSITTTLSPNDLRVKQLLE